MSIDENDDYIENFFGDNINVTAIAGENGSGKSSLLELIAKIVSNDIVDIKYILLTNEISFCQYTNINFTSLKKQAIDNGQINNKYFIFHSNSFTSGYFDSLIDEFSSKNYKSYNDSKIRNQSSLNQFINGNRVLESYTLGSLQYRQQHSLFLNEFLTVYKNSKILMQLDFIEKFGENYFPFKLPSYLNISIEHNKNTAAIHQDSFYKQVEEIIKSYRNQNNFEDIEYRFTQNEKEFLDLMEKYSLMEIDKTSSFSLDLERAKKFINIYSRLKIKIFDLEWSGLSSGQEALLNLNTLLLHGLESLHGTDAEGKLDIVVALDEIENSFHPLWQKNIFKKLLDFFNYLKDFYTPSLNIHILFTSHSPFLLSDIPKENIILMKDELENKQTFGANIHTLLSDSFFMKDGLMGEFAKSKINKIVRFLNGKNKFIDFPIEQIKQVINIIGEPFLKEKLLRMYDEKYPKSKEEKIAELEAEIERLKNGQN